MKQRLAHPGWREAVIAAVTSALLVTCLAAPLRSWAAESNAGPTVAVREIGGCSNALPWTKSTDVREVTRDGEDLVVSVLANAACGGLRAELPQADVSPNTLALSWVWTNPDRAPLAACKCTRHLQFRVSPAPGGDFSARAEAR